METKLLHEKFLQSTGVSIDTRKINPGAMFIAIKGERFDANTFAAQALERGASCVVIDNAEYHMDDRTIVVPDSLSALQQLAQYHRDYLALPVVALTGSNGKTTTKELMHVVLQKKFNCKATTGNLNNHIGVPLTLLSFDKHTEIGIVEMGANHQKEIDFLCRLAKPDFGYITNFGKAHLEGFGGVQGVIKGKSEMYDYLRSAAKRAFVNLDDPIQAERTAVIKRTTFGFNRNDVDVKIASIEADPFVKVQFDDTTVTSRLIGRYNANNVNAAITVGKYFGVSDTDIKAAIEAYVPENNRSQLLVKDGNEIILDAYNANPSSMAAAIENFLQLDNGSEAKPRKIAILGDMFELGDESIVEHRNIIRLLDGRNDVDAYFVGKDFYANRTDSAYMHFYESFEALAQNFCISGPAKILIKGSRGMALERVLEML